MPVPAGDDHLPEVTEPFRLLLEEVDVLAVVGVIAEGQVATSERHIALLAGAEVVEHALLIPVIRVAELVPRLPRSRRR